jgi:pre-mRNA-processing factor 8
MAIPPYLLGPNPWAQMMVQQQAHAQLAAVQAHAQAAAQAQAVHHAHVQAMSGGGPSISQSSKQPEIISEDRLQEKGKLTYETNIQ